jgi:hypothetical protein
VTRHLLSAATVAVAVALGAPALAHAQSDVAPTPVSPSEGKALRVGVPFTFKARMFPDVPGASVFFKVSKSQATDADGTLLNDIYFREMTRHGSLYTKKVERYASLSDHFLNRPGRYYWQAYTIDCSDGTDDCNVEGPIYSFRIKR